MRKNYQMWLLGALFGGLVLPFAGCSNEDDPISNGPGNGEEYNTQFTVAFTKNGSETKASEDEVGNGNFQGMKSPKLLAFTGYENTSIPPSYKVLATSMLNSENTLDPIPAVDNNAAFVETYTISLNPADVSFLFYGESNYTGVGALTPSYTTGRADGTSFSLVELSANTSVTNMTNYIQHVVAAVKANMKQGDIAVANKLKNFFVGCTSPALYQVAYMMAQLYLADDLYTDASGLDAVKNAIINGNGSNPVFSGLDGSEDSIDDIMACVTGDEDYLGEGFPKGGKVLKISNFNGTGSVTVTIENETATTAYYKPTSLWYMANTYPVKYQNETAGQWATLSSEFVNLSTQPTYAIALYEQIQYAVGQLDLTVNVTDEIVGNDNNTSPSVGDGSIDYTTAISAEKIKLMGVIINNQKEVGWDFQPESTLDYSTHMAYDVNGITNPAADPSGDYGVNKMKMLALPTKPAQQVSIVLEMKNEGTAFKGVNGGIIPAKGTFYVVANLNPDNGLWEGTGEPIQDPAVFMSDYITKVTLNLKSLKSAYNTVPDLSASNLEFALSVDLTWKAGYSYTVDID